jgi:hypothetical protein
MKNLVTALSSIFLGHLAAAPFFELQKILEGRKKFLWSVIFGAVSFVFLMAGILIGLIDAALQYGAQGFVFWDMLLALSLGLAVGSAVFALIAKRIMPHPEKSEVMSGILRKILEISAQFAEEHKPAPVDRERDYPPRHSDTSHYAH